ncbi:hypothetical protein QTP86_016510 [Hemibagrus guttatus]|nr:hypothetical protein QTP86_016510 [Hemibagrus guttatus]
MSDDLSPAGPKAPTGREGGKCGRRSPPPMRNEAERVPAMKRKKKQVSSGPSSADRSEAASCMETGREKRPPQERGGAMHPYRRKTKNNNPSRRPHRIRKTAMLQTISPDLLPFITTVINGSLMSGHVPTVFKKARVIHILKKPALDPSDISNYRPVSLLSFLSKILERVVCNQLSDYLMQNNLHDPNQSGFKAAHSTETALLAVTEKLHAARSAKLSSVLILLDLSAAFDTVNHKTLLSTLRSLGICGTAWEWFASYLDGRSYQVTWKGLTSAPRRLSTGVPQGSVLGPLLFSLYTHSLDKVISSHGFS